MLEQHAANQQSVWKANVRAMTKQWLDMGLRPRAVTRDLDWGIQLPLEGDDWVGKCIYVWFEAVQGYLSCVQNYGHSDMQTQQIGKSGGRYLKLEKNLGTSTSLEKITSHFTQSYGLL